MSYLSWKHSLKKSGHAERNIGKYKTVTDNPNRMVSLSMFSFFKPLHIRSTFDLSFDPF